MLSHIQLQKQLYNQMFQITVTVTSSLIPFHTTLTTNPTTILTNKLIFTSIQFSSFDFLTFKLFSLFLTLLLLLLLLPQLI